MISDGFMLALGLINVHQWQFLLQRVRHPAEIGGQLSLPLHCFLNRSCRSVDRWRHANWDSKRFASGTEASLWDRIKSTPVIHQKERKIIGFSWVIWIGSTIIPIHSAFCPYLGKPYKHWVNIWQTDYKTVEGKSSNAISICLLAGKSMGWTVNK